MKEREYFLSVKFIQKYVSSGLEFVPLEQEYCWESHEKVERDLSLSYSI